MISPQPENNPAGANRPQSPPLIRYDLAAMIKADPYLCRVISIRLADMHWLSLTLHARVVFSGKVFHDAALIECVDAVDFAVRPTNPATIEGGPCIEFHEQHPLLSDVSQAVPNTDGMEIYDPPVKFGVLILDQSYVIAGQFALSLLSWNKSGLGERKEADLQRKREWMEPFRLTKLKGFPTRSLRTHH